MKELIEKFKLMKTDNMKIYDPNGIEVIDSNGNKFYYYFSKSARSILYNKIIGIKYQTVKDLKEISDELWRHAISCALTEDRLETIENLRYIVFGEDNNRIVGFYEDSDNDIFNKLIELLNACDNFPHKVSFNDDIVKIILDISGNDDYSIISLIEMNFRDSNFKLSFGTTEDSVIALLPPTLVFNDFVKFISSDIDYEISLSKEIFKDRDTVVYDRELASNMYLSMREILDILNIANVKVTVNKDGTVSSDNIPDRIANYFNSTGITYKGIKKMPYLSKSIRFRYSIDLDYMLSYISDRYYNDDNLSSRVIDNIMNIYNKMSDFGIVKRSEVIKFAKEE